MAHRNVALLGLAPDQAVRQAGHIGPLSLWRPGDDGNLFFVLPVQADRHPEGGVGQRHGNVPPAHAGQPRPRLVVAGRNLQRRLAPVGAPVDQALLQIDGQRLIGQGAQHLGVGAGKTRFNLGLDARGELRTTHQRLGTGTQVSQQDARLRHDGVHRLRIGHPNHQLRVGRIGLFRICRGSEARRTGTDEAGHGQNAFLGQQGLFNAAQVLGGGADVRALSQPVVHIEQRRVGGRKKALLDELKAPQATGQNEHDQARGPPSAAQAQADEAPIGAVGPAGVKHRLRLRGPRL